MAHQAAEPGVLTVAVLGAGKIAEEHLRFLQKSPQVRLAAICDLSPALAQFTGRRFGVPQIFRDHHRMLAQVRPDVVHVLTPPHTHLPLGADCLDAGAHLIVEKPIAPSYPQFLQLWSHARKRNRQVIEDHNYRFNAPLRQLEQLVEQGQLGQLREVEIRLALQVCAAESRYADGNLRHPSHDLPAGVVHEFLPHLCYLTTRFLPSCERVAAAWSNHSQNPLFKYDDLEALIVGGDVHAHLRFSAHTLPETFTITLRGAHGSAQTDLFLPAMLRHLPSRLGPQLTPLANQVANGWALLRGGVCNFRDKLLQKNAYDGLHTFLERTYSALLSGGEMPVTFQDMDLASRLLDRLLCQANHI